MKSEDSDSLHQTGDMRPGQWILKIRSRDLAAVPRDNKLTYFPFELFTTADQLLTRLRGSIFPQ
jgi:hypothetical protein